MVIIGQEGSRSREERLKLKERERRVLDLEGRFDTIITIDTSIIIDITNIVIAIMIIVVFTLITLVRLKDDQLMGRIREAEHSQQVADDDDDDDCID